MTDICTRLGNNFWSGRRRSTRTAGNTRAKGFRAGVLYRKQLWYDALDFEYDMSVPNVAHLDPQRGGCCTVMPYFLGNLLELPVTTTQDYTLFNILNDYSTNLWERQIELIMEKHGLMSFVVHPDYIMGSRECRTYQGPAQSSGSFERRKTRLDHNTWRCESLVEAAGGNDAG